MRADINFVQDAAARTLEIIHTTYDSCTTSSRYLHRSKPTEATPDLNSAYHAFHVQETSWWEARRFVIGSIT